MENWPEFIKEHFGTVEYFQFMDATVLSTSRGYAKIKLPLKPQYANSYGIAHGGIMASLVDMAAGIAFRTLQHVVLTVEVSINYFMPVSLDDELTAEAQVVKETRKILHADINVYNGKNDLVANGKAIYYISGEDRKENYTQFKINRDVLTGSPAKRTTPT